VPALIGDQAHYVLDALIDGEPEGEPGYLTQIIGTVEALSVLCPGTFCA